MMKFGRLVLLFVFCIVGCSSGLQTDRPYQEIGRAQHFVLHQPGYVIGMEKRSIITEDGKLLSGLTSNKNPYENRFSIKNNEQEKVKDRNDEFIGATTNQNKVMLVTQITKSANTDGVGYNQYLYNAYKDSLGGVYDYEVSFSQVDAMFRDFGEQLKSEQEPFTHVLIVSMGWNNDQAESLWRYNRILDNLESEARKNNKTFKPIVIAFTWPSVWGGVTDSSWLRTIRHLASYITKADDADEIGYTWGNWIINHKLPEVIECECLKVKPKVVMIGHSFGARLLSRALFSSGYMSGQHQHKSVVDLFLGLQGAFSARRFVEDEGVEGYPYSEFNSLPTKIILTTSSNDKSNFAAIWAKNVGGPNGLKYARKKGDVFHIETWDNNAMKALPVTDKVVMVDATSIVNGDHKSEGSEGVDAHNDILDAEMGRLIWNFTY